MPNPILPGRFADPELRVFGGTYYIYPTTSLPFDEQLTFDCWSSPDLINWARHADILDLRNVPWSGQRCAWAPSCIERDGRFYFYFSAGDGNGIGVAVSDYPTGPFKDALGKPLIGEYILGAQPIDACAYLDTDGQAYLYFGGWRHAIVVPLGKDMISLAGEYRELTPHPDYVEGPFVFKRNGVYYFMWSEGDWGNDTYRAAYGRAASPYGPFEREGFVLRNNPVAKGAGHHSVLQLPGTDRWVIAYHRRPLNSADCHDRHTCLEELLFDPEGRILQCVPTQGGVPEHRLTTE